MDKRYFLSFSGTPAPQQPIDPATFPVVIRYELQQPPDDEPLPFWWASNENGRGRVVDSSAAVYGADDLGHLIEMLAAEGFRKVSIDMASVPAMPPSRQYQDDDSIPF